VNETNQNNNNNNQNEKLHLQYNLMYLIAFILRNPAILKIGFQFHHEDMAMLSKVFQNKFSNYIRPIYSMVDIYTEIEKITSLSFVCQQYLGKLLNKSYRLTDWRKRPLNEEQLMYAALDVHCLLGIFEAMLLEKGVDVGLHVKEMYLGDSTISSSNSMNCENQREPVLCEELLHGNGSLLKTGTELVSGSAIQKEMQLNP
jgi:hypothetical protein